MKGFFRSGPVVSVLGVLIWAYMVLIGRSVRWTIEGKPEAMKAWAHRPGLVLTCWHSRILLLPSVWTREVRTWPAREAPVAMLVSLSKDGEAVTKAVEHLGLEVIRGSAANKKKQRKDKGGIRAVAEAIRKLNAGAGLCITPDGPRGPRQIASPGAILLAQRTGSPILPIGVATKPAKRLKTWDRFMVPFPFTRGTIIFGTPIYTTRADDPDELLKALQSNLDAATERAETLLGLEPIPLDGHPAR